MYVELVYCPAACKDEDRERPLKRSSGQRDFTEKIKVKTVAT